MINPYSDPSPYEARVQRAIDMAKYDADEDLTFILRLVADGHALARRLPPATQKGDPSDFPKEEVWMAVDSAIRAILRSNETLASVAGDIEDFTPANMVWGETDLLTDADLIAIENNILERVADKAESSYGDEPDYYWGE